MKNPMNRFSPEEVEIVELLSYIDYLEILGFTHGFQLGRNSEMSRSSEKLPSMGSLRLYVSYLLEKLEGLSESKGIHILVEPYERFKVRRFPAKEWGSC